MSPRAALPLRGLSGRDRVIDSIVWFVLLGIVTAGLFALRHTLDKAHIALVYVLVVLGASTRGGRRTGMATALVAFLLFNFFFVPPYFTLIVTHAADWVVLATFLITSATAAHLLSRFQSVASAAESRALEIDRLSALGAEALNVARPEHALTAIAEVIRATLGVSRTEVYLQSGAGKIELVAEAGASQSIANDGFVAAAQLTEWVALSGQGVVERGDAVARALGPSTPSEDALDRIGDGRGVLLPLQVQGRTVGVLRIAHTEELRLTDAQRRFIMTLAYYAALGAERVRLAGEAYHAEALREADRLKDGLLASVSHDLRTPLTTIKALAQDIRLEGDDRAAIIEEEADRLNRFVSDLLDMSRLAAGGITLRPEMYALDDLLGAALQRVTGRSQGREVRTALVGDDPLLIGQFDFTHALRALVNLLENALKYSPADQPIDVTASRSGSSLHIAVADRGPGIPSKHEARLFQPFGTAQEGDRAGVGLGLSIARGLAEAQGGGVDYAPRSGGGSVFVLRLPAADSSAVNSGSL